jgi:hypothetical protein
LLPDAEQWTNGGKSRGSSVAHPAGLRVEQTFERQLAGDQQLPLLAGCAQWQMRLIAAIENLRFLQRDLNNYQTCY